LKAGVAPAGIEYYLPLFFDATATLFDYLDERTLAVVGEGAGDAADQFHAHVAERYEQRRHDVERPLLPPGELYLAPDALRERLNGLQRVEVWGPKHARHGEAQALAVHAAPELPLAAKDHAPAEALKTFLGSYPGAVLVAADSPGRREALLEVLASAGLTPEVVGGFGEFVGRACPSSGPSGHLLPAGRGEGKTAARGEGKTAGLGFAIAVAPLEDGFAVEEPAFVVLTERQLFPERAGLPKRRRRAGREPEAIIRDLGELSEGAPIVHEDHGVGRYRGLVTLEAGGQPAEYLEIEYAKRARLYVPVAQLHRINRYSGAAPETAPLHSLGGEQWTKAKKKAAEKVRDVAAELLEIQAKRQARAGLALPVD